MTSLAKLLRVTVAVLIVACSSLFPVAARAQDGDVLKGRTVRVIIGGAPGETTDTDSRTFFTHLQAALPQTTFRLQNDGGNAGASAIIELMNASGRVVTLATFGYGAVERQLAAPGSTPFDVAQLKWVGSLSKVNRILAMRKGLNGTTLAALRELGRQPVAGTTGALTASTIEVLLLNAMTDLRMKVVVGMAEAQRQAMIVAGDVDLRTGGPLELIPRFEAGEMFPVLKFTKEGYPAALDAVPAIAEVVRADTPREIVSLMESLDRFGGGMIAAAPATDAADLEALRRAFAAVVADPAFLRDAAKNRSAVSPTDGAKLTELVAQIVGRSSRVGELVRAMIECGKKVSDTGVAGCP